MSSQTNIILHDRPISDVRFNRDSDLLFTASKDFTASVTRLPDSMIGTFDYHQGAILCMDISNDSTKLVTGGADKLIIKWDVETGIPLEKYSCDSMIRSVNFDLNNNIYYVNDDTFNQKPNFGHINQTHTKQNLNFVPTSSVIKFDNQFAVISDSSGNLHKLDIRNYTIQTMQIHTDKINRIRNSFCGSFIITASNDCLSKIVDYELDVVKTFVMENPVNGAVIFRNNDKIVCGGGMSARDVTTTRADCAFEANFFDIVTGKFVGSYNTHFGTINCVDVNPNNEMYATGGEDGVVCVVKMGDDFMDANFTEF